MIFAAAVNIALDPLLILGIGGFPRMELQGAAIATVVSRGTTLIAALFVLHFREKMLYLKLPTIQDTLWCWKDILYVGLPAAGSSMINPISIGVITSFLAGFGAEAVAAFGVASRIESFALIAVVALSSSIAPFVGQNWGAKKYARVAKALQLSVLFSLFWGLMVAGILAVSAPTLIAFFNPNPDIVAIASQYLWIVPISYAGAGIILVASSVFNALGKPIPSVIMTVARMFVLYIPLAYFGGKLYGVNGIFGAACISNLIVGIGAYLWNQKTCTGKAIDSAEIVKN
jgi:Na+-driven multidrug efflux pump